MSDDNCDNNKNTVTLRSPSKYINKNVNVKSPQFNEEGLVIPRKINNPCLESNERQSLHKELLWNQVTGKNVLDQKSELQKVIEKRKVEKQKKEIEAEKLSRRSSLERRLEEQQLKLQKEEGKIGSGVSEKSEDQPEFLKVHAKVCATLQNSDDSSKKNALLIPK